MKNAVFALSLLAFVACNAEVVWTWWPGVPDSNAQKSISGAALGIGSKVKEVKSGAEVSFFYNDTQKIDNGAQVSMGLNRAEKVKHGAQVGLVNIADEAQVQVGLLCFNKKGFLPVFPFFNISRKTLGND